MFDNTRKCSRLINELRRLAFQSLLRKQEMSLYKRPARSVSEY